MVDDMNDRAGNVQLKYGKEVVSLSLPESGKELAIQEPEVDIDEKKFREGFVKLLQGRNCPETVAIVVADKTRLCGYDQILPWVTDELEAVGVLPEKIVFYIAYGTHPPQSDEESKAAYGKTYEKYSFVHHDCHDKEQFVRLGSTSRGTAVEVRKDILAADLILTIGAVSHHYFAGYGGARKLLFPGVAERNAIYTNHKLFLDRENSCLSAGCWPGNLEGNPLADDLKEVHDLLPEYLSIHAILDSKGKPTQYFFGSNYDEFLSVCKRLDTYYMVDVEEQFDTVIVSAGGYPKDINMIQAHKSIHNAANLVKSGGKLIVLAECIDGVGSQTFLPYFRMGGWKNTFAELADNYAGNGGTALAMMEKTARIDIVMMTSLSDEICSEIGVNRSSKEDIRKMIETSSGTLAYISNGSLLVSKRMV